MRTIFSGSAETLDVEDPGILPNGKLNWKVQWHVGAARDKDREKWRGKGEEKYGESEGEERERGGRKGRNDWHLGKCLVKTGRSREASNSASFFLSGRARTRKSVTKICVR